MTLALLAKMTNPAYMRGEEIYLSFEVSNSGSQPVEIGHPVITGDCWYALTTPEGRKLGQSGRAWLHPSIPDSDREKMPEPTSVTPDVRWSGCVELGELFNFETNGRYRLQVSFSWDQVRLKSEPLEFQIEDLEVLQVSRASSGGRERGDSGLVFLRRTGEGREYLYSHIQNVRDECGYSGTPKLGGPHLIRALPKGAVDPVYPSDNPLSSAFQWHFWREGNSLRWIHVSDDKTLPLPGTVDRLLDPALLNGKSGVNHVYALSSKESVPRLVVVRIMSYLEDGYQPERIQAELPLAVRPLGAAAEMDSLRGRPHRNVVLGAIDGGAPRVDWISYPGDAVPEKMQSHVWKKCSVAEAIPDARPTILHSKDGGLRVAWIAREWGRPERGLFCDAEFDASGALKGETVTRIEAETPILAARIVFPDDAPIVALWTEDGGVRAGQPAGLKPLKRAGDRRLTPMLVVFRDVPYVLDFSPVEGLVFLPIAGFGGRRR